MQNLSTLRPDGVPESFYSKFGQYVTGVLSGFDRIRFRATLWPLFCPEGPEVYLNHCKVLIKHFKGFAQGISDRIKRSEGVRIRHTLNGNSLKMYDKEGSILRVETTIVRPKDFRVYRAKEGQLKGLKSWRILRKGVSDMYRRAEVCRAANQRYLEALASVTGTSSLLQEAAEVCGPIIRNGKRYRGLNALAQKDHALLRALNRGEFALSGIRNADLRALLYPPTKTKPTKAELRRRSAAVTRQLALLRAHRLLRKLPRTHRYQITSKGRRILTALLAACYADVEQLTKLAA
jgi:hypothetical protein